MHVCATQRWTTVHVWRTALGKLCVPPATVFQQGQGAHLAASSPRVALHPGGPPAMVSARGKAAPGYGPAPPAGGGRYHQCPLQGRTGRLWPAPAAGSPRYCHQSRTLASLRQGLAPAPVAGAPDYHLSCSWPYACCDLVTAAVVLQLVPVAAGQRLLCQVSGHYQHPSGWAP
jgi:hypothetical protein